MRNTPLGLLLLVCVAALHADASQEAQLRRFIRSRRSSSNANNIDEPRVGITTTTRSPTEYYVHDLANLKAADKIHVLPGQPSGTIGLNQYGGYVTVHEKNGRALFYYFVEAASDAAAKPLLLWLNGGPGCSSLGYGAMMEVGPFRVNKDNRTLSENLHTWTKVANVLFLESPVGVGFSYSNTTSEYDSSGDKRTANDAFVFLLNWLKRFPEYKGRPFYISGESYAGHYVPQLAATILIHNLNSSTRTSINLRGILVGNPYLDANMNNKGKVDYQWSHGLISNEVRANITENCHLDKPGYTACVEDMIHGPHSNIDPYDVYEPVCLEGPIETRYHSRYIPRSYDICSDRYVYVYLNDPRVQKALHARSQEWQLCSSLNWMDAPASMVPTLKWLIEHHLPVWLYSGDFDSVCPFIATSYTIEDLGLDVTEQWRPWIVKDETGGFVQGYTGGLVFATVRAAGHAVPSYQPEAALMLVSSFLNGTLPPRDEGA
ncbi:serine carboxypeptidase 1-like [Triticum dicoccoides]|uniref:serine carboxypeptidase 1-like n=1 Tax=Triticum dicoccoides TaxID=85692 RepID=UPI000E7BBB05|nr:serine carboxypeptidase 1-like [Triticum dicoccoides]